jgi:hypothetical protein
MVFKLMLFSLLFPLLLLADSGEKVLNQYDPKTDIVSEKYELGSFLIYDCQDQHWVCVLEQYYKDCEKIREQAIFDKKDNLGCLPVGDLENKKACFQKQLYFVSHFYGARQCIGDDWKQKSVRY